MVNVILAGGSGVLWSILWVLCMRDNPTKHPTISRIEQEYIVRSLQHQVDFSNVSCLFCEKTKIEGNICNIQRNPITLAQIHKPNAYRVKNRLFSFFQCLSAWMKTRKYHHDL